jgi:hypothetical protein
MHQFEEFRLRPRFAHLFDHAERDAAAPMDRHAGRFVDHEHVLVFKNNFEIGARHRRLSDRFVRLSDTNGRHAHQIAQLEAVLRVYPALIDRTFPATQDAVDMAFGHALTDAQKEVINALSGRTVVDLDHRDLVACDRFLGYFA